PRVCAYPHRTELSTLSLHDALPICCTAERPQRNLLHKTGSASSFHFSVCDFRRRNSPEGKNPRQGGISGLGYQNLPDKGVRRGLDRKSTRLNSSHVKISYAVFCLKK